MINPKLIIGEPIPFSNICKIYPPKIKDVIANDEYNFYRKFLTITQEEIEDDFVENDLDLKNLINPLEYLLNLAYNDKQLYQMILRGFQFFIHQDAHLLFKDKKIVLGDADTIIKMNSIQDIKIIDETNYFDFQNAIRESVGEDPVEPPKEDEDPRIKKMKAKARYRDKIKQKKGLNLSLSASLLSIFCMNFGLNPLNIGELSSGLIPSLIRYYQEKEKYETDVQSLLHGADSKKVKLKTWIRNIED